MLETKGNLNTVGPYKIRTFDDPILKMSAKEITNVDKNVVSLVQNLERFLFGNAIGVAAPQIGVQRAVFVWKLPNEQVNHILNPRIVGSNGATIYNEEGCLSYPGYVFLIPRIEEITVQGVNIHGKKLEFKCNDLKSRLFQHEIDHLFGITPPMRAVQNRKLD